MNEIQNKEWEFVVIGTGIGGSTIGYELAKAGKQVLFVEKGRAYYNSRDALLGNYPEHYFGKGLEEDLLARAGRWNEKIWDSTSSRKAYELTPIIGCGTGGSSALYGMIMQRFLPEDFEVKKYFGHVHEANVPEQWPIDYEQLRPHYQRAEKLYGVRGQIDPLHSSSCDSLGAPPPLSPVSQEMFDFLYAKGLHPYQLPMACEYLSNCQECLGYLCPLSCKNDSAQSCLIPALRKFGATLIDQCEVTLLKSARDRVTEICCRRNNGNFFIKAKTVILAAGAISSAALLLKSKSSSSPSGLANESGLVGKNFMRHIFNHFAIETHSKPLENPLIKQIGFNDLYCNENTKLGTVQAVGRITNSSSMLRMFLDRTRREKSPLMANLLKPFSPFLQYYLDRNIYQRMLFTAIMEDLPYLSNKIEVSDDQNPKIQLHYKVQPYDKERAEQFCNKLKAIFKPYRYTFFSYSDNNEWISHMCGTCRFGNDPKTSVLNKFNRAHSLENLYVVDASFFPTSSGTNPALTIAANALRVADSIIDNSMGA